jgi:hypothetical protein
MAIEPKLRSPVTLYDEAGNAITVFTTQGLGVSEGGLTELVGTDEEVKQNEYGGSVAVALGGAYSGTITQVMLLTSESGTGSILTPSGRLFIFDADPSISSGASAIPVLSWPFVIADIRVASSDWDSDANGAVAAVLDQPVDFHELSTLYFAWLHKDATSFNDAAGDDEQLRFNFWYQRSS